MVPVTDFRETVRISWEEGKRCPFHGADHTTREDRPWDGSKIEEARRGWKEMCKTIFTFIPRLSPSSSFRFVGERERAAFSAKFESF